MLASFHGSEAAYGDRIIDEMLRLSRAALNASASAVVWLDDLGTFRVGGNQGVPQSSWHDYAAGRLDDSDPLGVEVLVANPRTIHCLSTLATDARSETQYAGFLLRYGFEDELDLVFCDDGRAIAVLSHFDCKPFAVDPAQVAALHRFLQFSLESHPAMRARARTRRLTHEFELTRREIDVLEMLRAGASNADVAASLEIGLATVKTHVLRILEKAAVNSRSELIALVSCG